MKSLVIAAATLALAGVALAEAPSQTAPIAATDPHVQEAVKAADQAAEAAELAAKKAVEDAAAAAESAADAAADAAARADDAAVRAAQGVTDAGATTGAAPEGAAVEAAEVAAEAAEQAAASASVAADAVTDEMPADGTAEDATTGDATADEVAADAAAPPAVIAPDVNPPAISEAEPGILSSWVTSRNIWTTNQPSSTVWVDPALEKRPGEWQNIAKVNDIVLDDSGEHVVGYVADIGGFLGIGAKKVLLGPGAIHLLTIGDETFFATNYTKEELEALPDFDEKTVRK
ncbi:MAG: PRC-barrel domain-containing protein [Paracoccus sp.]|nr:PRC-barrel domain-containing protein [Paracoccus sp. (in: a-proteobacteria)]